MAPFKVGIIGCGGRGKAHAEGYIASPDVEIVACADPVEAGRIEFMEDLDFVSVCTWIGLHKEMIVAAAHSGIKAIHSEKPMAPTWGEAKALYQACVDNQVVITFCHQRRFAAQFVKAKQLVDSGAIGHLLRVEGGCSNLFDWGTHWFDMFFFYNNDAPASWVMGQIDVREEQSIFGVPIETSGVAWVRWENGLEGLLNTGQASQDIGPHNVLTGTAGRIEVGGRDRPLLRLFRQGGWEEPVLDGMVPPGGDTILSVLDLIDCVKTGREPTLSGRKALQATELIFATYESSRSRSRVDLPLCCEDSPLLTMLADGTIGPS